MWTEEEREQFSEFVNKVLYETLTDDDYDRVVTKLGATKRNGRYSTICHGGHNHNLAYRDKTFTCFSECSCSFSLLSLVKKVKHCSTTSAMKFICQECGIEYNFKEEIKQNGTIYNWKGTLGKYLKRNNGEVDLVVYDKNILNSFDKIYSQSWIDEGISIETMEKYHILYYNREDSIVIPCMDAEGQMIGIRQRFLNPNSDYKYLPLEMLNGESFKFPTNQVLYGLNYNAQSISHYKKCVLCEAEKSVLMADTMFGDKSYTLAMYGHSMSLQRVKQILKLGVEEIIICLDFDYKSVTNDKGDFTEEFERFKDNVYKIGDYFKGHCKVTALIEYGEHPLKCSPFDLGKEKYLELYNRRENLYE